MTVIVPGERFSIRNRSGVVMGVAMRRPFGIRTAIQVSSVIAGSCLRGGVMNVVARRRLVRVVWRASIVGVRGRDEPREQQDGGAACETSRG